MDEEPQEAPHAAQSPAEARNDATATTAGSGASDAPAALHRELLYNLTVPQARALFTERSRKVPADRTLQSYCSQGVIAAQKIRTTYGAEWLINEESLRAFIDAQPMLTTAEAPHAAQSPAEARNDATATTAGSGASDAPPPKPAAAVGESRSIAEVLIENARLLATLDGKDQVIAGKDDTITELRDDRGFLREELREARRQRDDVKTIANRMLETLESMALGGKLLRTRQTEAPQESEVIRDTPVPAQDAGTV